jgi:hypothetical protein
MKMTKVMAIKFLGTKPGNDQELTARKEGAGVKPKAQL